MSDELNALAGAYALDALSENERAIFEQHLESCTDCADEVLGMQNAAAELSYIEAVTPPPELRADVLSAIKRVRPLPPQGNIIPIGRARRSKAPLQFLAAACTLIAVVAAGWGFQQHGAANRASHENAAISKVLSAPDTMAASTKFGAGITTVVYSKANNALVMNASGVATLASDKTYQAWLVAPDGKATSLGTFKPNSHGDVTMEATGNIAAAASVGVTVEPAGGSKIPTSKPVIVNL